MPRELLVPREIDETAAQFVTSMSLRNACVAFHDESHSQYRAHIVAESDLPSPLIMHAFSERALGYVRLTSVRKAGEYERHALTMCRRAPLGLGVPLSHPTSIYHQLYHAVPSFLYLREHVAAAGWGADAPASAFVPLALASAALGRGKPAAPRRWYAWELTLRALTRASPDVIAAAASKLLRTQCTCFARFEASAHAFNPGARADAQRVRAFREAALRNGMPSQALLAAHATAGVARDMLLVSRQGERRALSNEERVLAALRGGSFARVRRVVLEEMSVADQMATVAGASALLGVHGQAFAWLPFLPWPTRPVGIIEISIASRRGAINACYERWSAALGVHYWRIAGVLTGGCNGGATGRDNEAMRAHKLLACNVTVDVQQLVGTAYRAAQVTGAGRTGST